MNSKKLLYAFFLASMINAIVVIPASARYLDGNRLKDLVDSDNRMDTKTNNDGDGFQSGVLFGFVVGVYESVEDSLVCSPENVKPGQLVGIVKKFVSDNPETWNTSAHTIVVKALSKTFPCKKEKRQKQSPRQ